MVISRETILDKDMIKSFLDEMLLASLSHRKIDIALDDMAKTEAYIQFIAVLRYAFDHENNKKTWLTKKYITDFSVNGINEYFENICLHEMTRRRGVSEFALITKQELIRLLLNIEITE